MQHFMCVFDQIALNTTSESFKLYVVIVWLSEKGVHSEAKKQVDFWGLSDQVLFQFYPQRET